MTKLAHLPSRAVIEVSGQDRVAFLQGLVSNDVAKAAPGQAVWAALLTPQGKWLADFFVTAEADCLLLDVEASQQDLLVQRLTRFRLRSNVAVQPLVRLVYAGWDGPAPPDAAPDPRLPGVGWRLLSETPAPAVNAREDEWDLHRLSLGLPDGSRDLEAGKTTLLEANFDELNGISWTKGCYMGQELTARTRYRGLLKRRLFPVEIDGPLPPPGAPILAAGAEVGVMRSGRGTRGLALLRIDAIDTKLLACEGAIMSPVIPRWMAITPAQVAEATA